MCFDDFIERFNSVTICRVRKWEEVRTRGCFVRTVEGDAGWVSGPQDAVISKWYYQLDISDKKG
jgi:hypothetical protein